MEFRPKVFDTFWNILDFNEEEVAGFFPKPNGRRYRYRRRDLETVEPTVNVLRQDVYEWCLENLGPEYYQDNPLERIYYDVADVPDITLPSVKKLFDIRYTDHRWCVADSRALAFKDHKDAVLFKLVWGGKHGTTE